MQRRSGPPHSSDRADVRHHRYSAVRSGRRIALRLRGGPLGEAGLHRSGHAAQESPSDGREHPVHRFKLRGVRDDTHPQEALDRPHVVGRSHRHRCLALGYRDDGQPTSVNRDRRDLRCRRDRGIL